MHNCVVIHGYQQKARDVKYCAENKAKIAIYDLKHRVGIMKKHAEDETLDKKLKAMNAA